MADGGCSGDGAGDLCGLPAEHRLYTNDSEDLEGVTGVLLDPSTLSNDWAVALSTYSISEDGK